MKNYCKSKSIQKDIKFTENETRSVKFFSVPLGTLYKLGMLGGPVADLVASIFSGFKVEGATSSVQTPDASITDKAGVPYMTSSVMKEEVSASAISLLHRQLSTSIAKLIETGLSDDLKNVISELIVKSASEEFTDENDQKTLFDNMDADLVLQFLSGAMQASQGALNTLGKLLPRQIQDVLAEKAKKALKQ